MSLTLTGAGSSGARSVSTAAWAGSAQAFNLEALGFLQPLDGATFPAAMTSTRMDAIVAAGVNWVRLPIDPTGWLGAANGTVEAQQIGYITAAVDALRAKDLKVLVDAHVNDFTGAYKVSTIAADYLLWAADNSTGPKYKRFQAFTQAIATALAAYGSDAVAYQLWNEIDTGLLTDAQWRAMNLDLQGKFRGNNSNTYNFVSGNSYSNIDGLVALNPAGFDARTVFCFTPYEPQLVTHQGLNDGGDPGFVGGSTTPAYWPPIPSDNAALKIAMHTAVDASSVSDKTGTKSRVDGYIDNLTQTGDGAAHAYDQTWLKARLALVTSWMAANSLSGSRVCITEFGVHGDSSGLGAAPNSTRYALTSFMRRWAETNGVSLAWWHYDPGLFQATNASYVLDDGLMIALSRTPSRSYDTAATAVITNMPMAPGNRQADLIFQCVKTLEDAGCWAKIFSLYMKVAATQQAGLIDWANPATRANDIAVHGGMTFTAYAGMHGDGSTGFMDATGNSLSGKLLQNNAGVGSYMGSSLSNGTYGNSIPNDTNGHVFLNVASDYFVPMLDGNFGFAGISPVSYNWRSGVGLGMADRSGAANIQVYQNGSLTGSVTDASTTAGYGYIEEFRSFGANYAPATAINFMTVYFASMTAAQHAIFYAAIDTYIREMRALGGLAEL